MPASTLTEYLAALPADRREALNEDEANWERLSGAVTRVLRRA